MASHIKRPYEIESCKLSDLEGTVRDVQREVDLLKEQGVNKIILLSHLGLPNEQHIAKNVSDIDVILGGHTHNLLREVKKGENLITSPKGEPVLIVQVGRDGENIAIPNLQFNELGQITKIQYNVIKTEDYQRSKVAKESFEKILGKSDIVGQASYVEEPPKDIYANENPHCDFILDCMLKEYEELDIALTNSANIRSRFHEGDIDTRDLNQITPFGNKMTITKITEKELVEAIDDKVEASMKNPNHRPGIIQVAGLRYEYSKSEGELTKLTFIDRDGEEHEIDIDEPREDKFYTVMADDYCFLNDNAGFGLKHRFEEAIAVYNFDKNKIVENYLRKHPEPIEIKSDGRIKAVD
jgi:2',3'-cyclic-nucleotide 2'-phosphodiesterase (5'-nucleotidase family)